MEYNLNDIREIGILDQLKSTLRRMDKENEEIKTILIEIRLNE